MKAYNKENIPLAKVLRKNMTPWERKLWYNFFAGVGHYTTEQAEKDEQRTNELNAMNLTVVRICNSDIDRNFYGVCEYIDHWVQNSLPQSASLTAPSSEGALDAATSKQ